jgi:hypothetical protein
MRRRRRRRAREAEIHQSKQKEDVNLCVCNVNGTKYKPSCDPASRRDTHDLSKTVSSSISKPMIAKFNTCTVVQLVRFDNLCPVCDLHVKTSLAGPIN